MNTSLAIPRDSSWLSTFFNDFLGEIPRFHFFYRVSLYQPLFVYPTLTLLEYWKVRRVTIFFSSFLTERFSACNQEGERRRCFLDKSFWSSILKLDFQAVRCVILSSYLTQFQTHCNRLSRGFYRSPRTLNWLETPNLPSVFAEIQIMFIFEENLSLS